MCLKPFPLYEVPLEMLKFRGLYSFGTINPKFDHLYVLMKSALLFLIYKTRIPSVPAEFHEVQKTEAFFETQTFFETT